MTLRTGAALGAILAAGLALRVIGLGWGLPGEVDFDRAPIHPDEHEAFFESANLYNQPTDMTFVKGGAFYIRLGWLARHTTEAFQTGASELDAMRGTIVLLRCMNLGLALGTAYLVAIIGFQLGGIAIGLGAAALLMAFPNHVLDSHYARPDVLVTFLSTAALACACRVARDGSVRVLALGGACSGLALATVLSGAVGFVPLVVGALEFRSRAGKGYGDIARDASAIALGAVAGYLVGNLEGLLFFDAFTAGLHAAAFTHQGGSIAFPQKLLGRVSLYAFGSAAAVAGYVGAVLLLLTRGRVVGALTIGSQLVFGYVLLGRVGGDMMRHLEIVAPATALAAVFALAAAVSRLVGDSPQRQKATAVAIGAVVLLSAQLSFTYVWSMQTAEDPRYRAGRWLNQNAAPGAKVGITSSFLGDQTFRPRLREEPAFDAGFLVMRDDWDSSGYLDLGLDFIATSDYARTHAGGETAPAFYAALFGGDGYRLATHAGPDQSVASLPLWLGLRMPGDLFYIRSTFYVFEKTRVE